MFFHNRLSQLEDHGIIFTKNLHLVNSFLMLHQDKDPKTALIFSATGVVGL